MPYLGLAAQPGHKSSVRLHGAEARSPLHHFLAAVFPNKVAPDRFLKIQTLHNFCASSSPSPHL